MWNKKGREDGGIGWELKYLGGMEFRLTAYNVNTGRVEEKVHQLQHEPRFGLDIQDVVDMENAMELLIQKVK
jgi:hypothetical protein